MRPVLALLLGVACKPDVLTVKDVPEPPSGDSDTDADSDTDSDTDSDADTDDTTGDTGSYVFPCDGLPPEVSNFTDGIVATENDTWIAGDLEGPGDICEISCDVDWLVPLLAREGTGCTDVIDFPRALEPGQHVQVCVAVYAAPNPPETGNCRLLGGGGLDVRWDVWRDD